MTQLSLLRHDSQTILINIDYDGFSADLQRHEIDARFYAISIGGYSRFLHEFISRIAGRNAEIYIIANEEGSFKTVIKLVCKTVAGYSILASILSFHDISARDVEKYIISLQEKIVELIAEHKGNTEKMIENVDSSTLFPDELKEIIKNIIRNAKARKGLDDFTKPLERLGYEKIEIYTRDEYSYTIYNNQRDSFKYTPPDIIIEEPFRETVRILYLSPELTEWKFQGTKDFWAEVQDVAFLDRTKNSLFSELQGKYYIVSGTAKTIRKEGARQGTTSWTINKVSEVQEFHSLL